ncbi:MAG: hypothetical protein U0793_24280 [Gemmataceae bacterium]
MRMVIKILAVATLLVGIPSRCFAVWDVEIVTKERAKELGMEFRATAAGPKHVAVELEFTPVGELKNFSRVDLVLGKGDKTELIAPLREDRSKPGRVVVRFTAERTHLDKLTLRVMVPGMLGGSIHEVPVKEFVGLTNAR